VVRHADDAHVGIVPLVVVAADLAILLCFGALADAAL
jgi:hypothetical protein